MSDTAVILFNLGGPTAPDTVKPFLFNLFNDKAIIGAPQPLRWLLATLIAGRRAPVARDIYAHLGGKSPIHEETDAQAAALEAALAERLGAADAPSVHVVMRYWGRRAEAVARDLSQRGIRRTILLPLYPQFSDDDIGLVGAGMERSGRRDRPRPGPWRHLLLSGKPGIRRGDGGQDRGNPGRA